ncbi:urease accessory protein UreJ [Pararhodobacter marinus]|uniref:Urease accessory protein UreJ n=1 Tax=Pararhodobacter marinus TaxID=2184063 RepID=A0A2U2CEP4_9RHOB|nr:HupE/UreJ family protein [Pararhodobacter marinus]PWE30375.1 urease accessory protein UreJ [Pararhodobacter marinus]
MKRLALSGALALLAAPAMAHTGHGAEGLAHGLAHPFLGADHLLAMVAVGLWSGLVLPRRVWAGAAAFMTAMITGAALGFAGAALPMAEGMIALSVIVFGLLVVMARRGQPRALTAVSLAAIAAFGTAHGYAHAVEATGSAAAYVAGFLIASAVLHASGILAARALVTGRLAQILAGGAVVAAGALLVAG